MPYKDPVKNKEYMNNYRKKNKEKNIDYLSKYHEKRRQHAYNSITSGNIIDQNKWNLWCNQIRSGTKNNNRPYSDDFTNDIIFEMMVRGCFYCGGIATTIDRIDSKMDHNPVNCVGCCVACNKSKGSADSSTFIRKAYHRARGDYYDDDTDIWFINKTKPSEYEYKKRANKQGVTYELTKEDFDILIKGDCNYCKRSPTTWFGIDKVIPSQGYTNENAVSCCWDCNLDKLDDGVDSMMKRNERIAYRVDIGDIIVEKCDKVREHFGTQPSSKKVCARGKVFTSMINASSELGRCTNYVYECINNKRHSEEIFEITDDFYEFAVNNNLEHITKKMHILFYRM